MWQVKSDKSLSASEINYDLANANNIVVITMLKEPGKSRLVRKMSKKFNELYKGKYKLNVESKLFLLALSINLTLYFFQHQSDEDSANKMIFYWEKLKECYREIHNESLLTDSQKANWVAFIGDIYKQIDDYEAAISCFKDAIAYKKNQIHDPQEALVIQSFMISLIWIYLKLGHHYTHKMYAPDLAKKRFLQAIEMADEALKIKSNHAPKIHYFKAQSLACYSELASKSKQFAKAIRLFVEALDSDYNGLILTVSPTVQQQYVKHMLKCSQNLLSILDNDALDKENIPHDELAIRRLCNLLEQFTADNLDKIKSILEELDPKVKINTNFWHVKQRNPVDNNISLERLEECTTKR